MQKLNTYHAKQGNIKTMVTSLRNTEEAALPTLQNNYTYVALRKSPDFAAMQYIKQRLFHN